MYSNILKDVMSEDLLAPCNTPLIEQNARDVNSLIASQFTAIEKRNQDLLFYGPIAQVSARLGNAVLDVKVWVQNNLILFS